MGIFDLPIYLKSLKLCKLVEKTAITTSVKYKKNIVLVGVVVVFRNDDYFSEETISEILGLAKQLCFGLSNHNQKLVDGQSLLIGN